MSTNVLIYQDHEKSKALMFLAKKCKAFMFYVLISSSFKAFMFLNRHVLIIKNLCSCEYMIIIIVLAKTTMIILTFFNAKSAKNTNNQNATHVGLEIVQAFKRYFCFCSTSNEKKTTDPFFSDDLLDYILLFKIYQRVRHGLWFLPNLIISNNLENRENSSLKYDKFLNLLVFFLKINNC